MTLSARSPTLVCALWTTTPARNEVQSQRAPVAPRELLGAVNSAYAASAPRLHHSRSASHVVDAATILRCRTDATVLSRLLRFDCLFDSPCSLLAQPRWMSSSSQQRTASQRLWKRCSYLGSVARIAIVTRVSCALPSACTDDDNNRGQGNEQRSFVRACSRHSSRAQPSSSAVYTRDCCNVVSACACT